MNNSKKYIPSEVEKLLEDVPIMMHSVDLKGVVQFANHAWLRKMGYTLEEVVGRPFFDFLIEKQDKVLAKLKSCLESVGAGREGDFCEELPIRLVAKSGEPVDILLSCSFLAGTSGDDTKLLAVSMDVSNSVRSQDKINALNHRLQQALEASEAGIFDLDIPTGRLDWDETQMKIFDQEPSEFKHSYEDWRQKAHPDDVPIVEENLQAALRGEKKFSVRFRIFDRKKQIRFLRGLGCVLRDDDGNPIRFIGTNWDITNLVNYENKILAAQKEAERANRAKSMFLAKMSHEIRTPLGAVIGFADLLKKQEFDEATRKEFLDRVVNNSRQLQLLIDDLLDVSQIEAQQFKLELKDVRLGELLTEVITSLSFELESSKCKVEVSDIEPSLSELFVDERRVKQVLFNIIGNATKFSPGGSIQVKVSSEGGVAVGSNKKRAEKIRVDVIDSGVGIVEELHDRIFDPFVQGTAVQKQGGKYPGTGLGLYVCQTVSKALGGDVELVRSSPGEGSHFSFTFLRNGRDFAVTDESASSVESAADAKSSDLPLQGLRTFLVEDTCDNQRLVEIHLKQRGASIDCATTGEKGIEMLMKSPESYDVVLMDLQLPGISGYQAVEMLRKQNFKTPIVALTAHHLVEERERAFKAGVDDFLSKPIDFNRLTKVLQGLR